MAKALYAVRYATDGRAPTLYAGEFGSGRCLVSEPFDPAAGAWTTIPQGSFVRVTRDSATISPLEFGVMTAADRAQAGRRFGPRPDRDG